MVIVLALIMLTSLDGSPVWVESNHVIILRHATSDCKSKTGSGILVGTTKLCVRETPEQIQEKLRKADGK